MFRQFRKIEKGEFIVVGADVSAGGRDYSVAQFISKKYIDVPLVYQSRRIATEMTNSIFPVLERIYDTTGVKPCIAYERNNGGVYELERLASMNRLGKFEIFKMPVFGKITTPEPVKIGWDTNPATRPKMLPDLKEAIDKRVLRIYDKTTIEELFSFVVVESSSSWKAKADVGAKDDCVMALAIAWQLYLLQKPPTSSFEIKKIIDEFPDEKIFTDEGFY